MKLRCKPGDIAVIVHDPELQYLGKVLRVLSINEELTARYARYEWEYERVSADIPDPAFFTIPDEVLCPINAPGITETDVAALYRPKLNDKELADLLESADRSPMV